MVVGAATTGESGSWTSNRPPHFAELCSKVSHFNDRGRNGRYATERKSLLRFQLMITNAVAMPTKRITVRLGAQQTQSRSPRLFHHDWHQSYATQSFFTRRYRQMINFAICSRCVHLKFKPSWLFVYPYYPGRTRQHSLLRWPQNLGQTPC